MIAEDLFLESIASWKNHQIFDRFFQGARDVIPVVVADQPLATMDSVDPITWAVAQGSPLIGAARDGGDIGFSMPNVALYSKTALFPFATWFSGLEEALIAAQSRDEINVINGETVSNVSNQIVSVDDLTVVSDAALIDFFVLEGEVYDFSLSGLNTAGVLGNGHDNLLQGSRGANRLFGPAGDDTLLGAGGDDLLRGGPGADSLDGGVSHHDVADYRRSPDAVSVDLDARLGFGGYAEGDTLTNVERVFGSKFSDTLARDSNENVIYGAGGNDLLIGRHKRDCLRGHQGEDTLFGGYGNDVLHGGPNGDMIDGGWASDLVDYRRSPSGVTIDRAANAGLRGDAEGDFIVNVERIVGSRHDDVLIGDAFANVINGGAGDDEIVGGAGPDMLRGNRGADTFVFGAGDSWVDAHDLISDYSGTTGDGDRIDVSTFATTFIGEALFTGRSGEVRVRVLNQRTQVEIDTDGNRMADFALSLATSHPLTADDIIV